MERPPIRQTEMLPADWASGAAYRSLPWFIRHARDSIITRFEQLAGVEGPVQQRRQRVDDDAYKLLEGIGDDMECSAGSASDTALRMPLLRLAQSFAQAHLQHELSMAHMAGHYRALRAAVLEHWSADRRSGPDDVEDVMRFTQTLDDAWAESAAWYVGQLERARDLFVGTLVHDLRTPLCAITTSSQTLLRDPRVDHHSRQYGQRIERAAERMRRLVADLLDVTRIRLGQLPLNQAWSSLSPALTQGIDELTAAHPGRHLGLSCEGDLLGHWDSGRLVQAVSNLVANAIRHGAPDTPVSVHVHGEAQTLQVSVHNWGPVIAGELQHAIFDPLTRGASSPAGREGFGEGLGLGLFICEHIVRAHGGRMELSSSAQDGTVFSLVVPKQGGATPLARPKG